MKGINTYAQWGTRKRICPICNQEVEDYFRTNSRCQSCRGRRNNDWWEKNRVRQLKKAHDRWVREHPDGYRTTEQKFKNAFTRSRANASTRGIPWKFETLEQFKAEFGGVFPETCPVLGIHLEYGRGKVSPTSPSLDRFDNTLPYQPGNVTIISHRANWLKGDATYDELQKVAKWMRKTVTARS